MRKKLTPEETRDKLREFLKDGNPEDIASMLFHALTQRADALTPQENLPKNRNRKYDA